MPHPILVCEGEADMMFLLDIDRQIETISFVSEGEGEIELVVMDSANSDILNVSTVVLL